MSESDERPGKIRTWWHPLLASLLRWQLGDHYGLQEEVPVGQKPLQIDILLLRREKGNLPEAARRLLAGLAERFNEFTLLEFKSPSDTLRVGDFQTFLSYALLYRAQNHPLLDPSRLTLLVLAPRLTKPYVEEMAVLGVKAAKAEEGVWQLEGGALAGHAAWVLETTTLAGAEHPVVTVMSQRLLYHGLRTYDEMREAGYRDLAVYVLQQIQQFQEQGKEFAMQHLGTETEMDQVMLELAKGWSAEFLRKVLPVEERLKGLTPEQLLAGLTPEERARLRELLNREAEQDSTDPK
jgi:hypothetical protein